MRTYMQMTESLDTLRNGLESHQGNLAVLCEDVGRRADEASKEMVDFKEKVLLLYCCVYRCTFVYFAVFYRGVYFICGYTAHAIIVIPVPPVNTYISPVWPDRFICFSVPMPCK